MKVVEKALADLYWLLQAGNEEAAVVLIARTRNRITAPAFTVRITFQGRHRSPWRISWPSALPNSPTPCPDPPSTGQGSHESRSLYLSSALPFMPCDGFIA